jgi:methylmalonyl-CoA mutase N-terminal domain/subunit
LSLPTEESVRTALRTQQVIAYESGVANTVDPLAGSFYIENLTDQIEHQATALMQKVEGAGGVIACIEDGFIQRQIDNAAYEYQQEIETGERIIVGVNKFQVEENAHPALQGLNPSLEEEQIERLRQVKLRRDSQEVQQALAYLRSAAAGSENLMPPILQAVREYATLGEICGVLRQVFGEYTG